MNRCTLVALLFAFAIAALIDETPLVEAGGLDAAEHQWAAANGLTPEAGPEAGARLAARVRRQSSFTWHTGSCCDCCGGVCGCNRCCTGGGTNNNGNNWHSNGCTTCMGNNGNGGNWNNGGCNTCGMNSNNGNQCGAGCSPCGSTASGCCCGK